MVIEHIHRLQGLGKDIFWGTMILSTTDKCPPPGCGEDETWPYLGECLAQSRPQCFFPISTHICLWCPLPPFWIISPGPDFVRTLSTHILSRWASSLFSFVPPAHIHNWPVSAAQAFDSERKSQREGGGFSDAIKL